MTTDVKISISIVSYNSLFSRFVLISCIATFFGDKILFFLCFNNCSEGIIHFIFINFFRIGEL